MKGLNSKRLPPVNSKYWPSDIYQTEDGVNFICVIWLITNTFFFLFTASRLSKRTITPTKKVTKEDFQKSKEDIEEVFGLFRDFVKANRPKLDIDKVATGETWFGTAALERKLCTYIYGFNPTVD
jgi:hypothetical protein